MKKRYYVLVYQAQAVWGTVIADSPEEAIKKLRNGEATEVDSTPDKYIWPKKWEARTNMPYGGGSGK